MVPSLVQLRPGAPETWVSRNRTVLVSDLSGRIREGEQGLWVMETRMLSKLEWCIDGRPPTPAGASPVAPHRWLGYAIAAAGGGSGGEPAAQRALELSLARTVGDGMREDVLLINHTQERVSVDLSLRLEADFAAPQEASGQRRHGGTVTRRWIDDRAGGARLVFDHRAQHSSRHGVRAEVARIHRALSVRVVHADSPARPGRGGLAFRVELPPHGVWRAELEYLAHVDGRDLPLGGEEGTTLPAPVRFAARSPGPMAAVAVAAFERAVEDLGALRLLDVDAFVCAGGAPTYLAFFGRDALVTALEAAMLGPELLRGTLEYLARTRATERDDWRDAQPGRMVHELHTDPLAALRIEPHGRYYGDVTASLLHPVALAAAWSWTGDEALVREHLGVALDAVAWADRWSRGDDGFYRYRARSPQGEKNQGWKDSSDAIVWPDGSQVAAPLGTCEMQVFAFVAKRVLGWLLRRFGRGAEAARFFREARELRARFRRTFWMEDVGWVGMAVDARGVLVRTIASDGAHCLGTGILEPAREARLAARMLQPDLFSGWGVRTLSSSHPAYDAFAYHRGTVWPVENAAIALGLARAGLEGPLHAVCRAQLEAASLFEGARLPETFAGHPRDDAHPFPGLYPRADWPQAWSASAIVAIVQALAGLTPQADRRRLCVRPRLPPWLPELELRGLRIGDGRASLRLVREPSGATRTEVTSVEGDLTVWPGPTRGPSG